MQRFSMLLFVVVVVVIELLNRPTNAQNNDVPAKNITCGKLNETYLNNGRSITEFDEFPWMGMVYSEDSTGRRYGKCSAVLISDRYLLGNAYCFTDSKQKPNIVKLGIWQLGNIANETETICDKKRKRCLPPPRSYEIDEVKSHPDFFGNANDDIALIRLKETVEFTDFIQPVCLPPDPTNETDYDFRIMTYTGWPEQHDLIRLPKSKLFAYVFNTKSCNEQFPEAYFSDDYICGYCGRRETLSIGSALLGIKKLNLKPIHYYVIGLITLRTGYCDPKRPDVFVRVDLYNDWIKSSMY